MRAHRLARADRTQELCVFCAFRYLSEPIAARPRRRLDGTRRTYTSQSQPRFGAAQAVRRREDDQQDSISSQYESPPTASKPPAPTPSRSAAPVSAGFGAASRPARSPAGFAPAAAGGSMMGSARTTPVPPPPEPSIPLPPRSTEPNLIRKTTVRSTQSGLDRGQGIDQRARDMFGSRSRSAQEPLPPARMGPRFQQLHDFKPELSANWKGLQRRQPAQDPTQAPQEQRFSIGRRDLNTPKPGFVSLAGPQTVFKCFTCGEVGHAAKDCPKPKKCRYCGTEGHDSWQCPDRIAGRSRNGMGYRDANTPRGNRHERTSRPTSTIRREGSETAQDNIVQTVPDVMSKSSEPAQGSTAPAQKAAPAIYQPLITPEPDLGRGLFEKPLSSAHSATSEVKAHQGSTPVDEKQTVEEDTARSTVPRRSQREAVDDEDTSSRPSRRQGARSRRDDDDDFEPRERQPKENRDLDERPSKASRREVEEIDISRSGRGKKGGKGKSAGRFEEFDEEAEDAELRVQNDRAERKRARQAAKQRAEEEAAQALVAKAAPTVRIPEHISVANLANSLNVRTDEFLEKVTELGFEGMTSDYVMNAENAALIAQEYGFEPVTGSADALEDLYPQPLPEDTSNLPQRPPVVTIMGHVDHGKTTILDYLRKSSIAASEHGGITQHIGAFVVPFANGKTITFLDTPGHAAFLSMRQRGANVTDIVVLVVAADDSVMPQTIEAIKHAKGANVPIIVAINKIDKEEANVERVKQDLARNNVEIEDFGGDTQVVPVSGKAGTGMDQLQESIVTLSEILDARAEAKGAVEGWILEAATKAYGRTATILVRRGTLRVGDIIVAGTGWGRVRTLRNEAGQVVQSAGPGTPIEVDGWREEVSAGDEVLQAPNEQRASEVIAYRRAQIERRQLAEDMEIINVNRQIESERQGREKALAKAKKTGKQEDADAAEALVATGHADDAEGSLANAKTGPQEVLFILKADVGGSAEAVSTAIQNIGNADIRTKVLRSGVGRITSWDVDHAAATGGHIINFNLPIDGRIQQAADQGGVQIVNASIIYRVVETVTELLTEKLPPLISQRVNGEAEVAQLFQISIKGRQKMWIAGCKVRNGIVERNSRVRVLRGANKEVVYDGVLTTLKNVKKDVTEMRKNTECGMSFENWEDMKEGDQVQCYTEVSEKRYL